MESPNKIAIYFKRISALAVLILFGFTLLAQNKVKVIHHYPGGKIQERGFMIGEQKTGNWIYYNELGQVTKKEKWKSGRFVWRVEFNEKNKKVRGMNAKGEEIIYKGCNCKN